MQKWKRMLVWVAALLAVLFFVPFLIPMGTYTKQAEEISSAKLGVPVTLGSLRLAVLPSPRLNIGGITVGKNNEVSVEGVSVVPALTSLLSKNIVISSVQIKKPAIKKAALDILANLSKKPDAEPSAITVSVRQINIDDAKLDWPNMNLPEINADITLGPENKPERAEIESVDGKLKLDLVPQDDHQLITLVAKEWTLPAGPPFLIDELRAEMVLTDKKLDMPKMDATLYGGKLSGNANLTWGKAYKLTGKTSLNNLAVREPARLMSKSTPVSGQLFSDGSFNATAKEAGQLVDKLNGNIKFNVKNGVLYGFDLAKAPLMLLGQGKGDETKFDELSGLLNISGKTYRLRNLKVKSGAMKAAGAVKINPNKTLDGEIEVEVENSMNLASIPLNVSGTLDSPMVLPTKAAIAGAVAGTAVLGPAGTGLGVKAVDKIKGLFGGDDK